MVHLNAVKNDSELPDLQSLNLGSDDEFGTAVYGSRIAACDLPANELPEKEMPKDIAYRMIKDELELDGNPKLKCVVSVEADPLPPLTSF